MRAAILMVALYGIAQGYSPSHPGGQAQPTASGIQRLKAPDGRFVAVVSPAGLEADESRVSILDRRGKQIRTHDFSSTDGDHGYGVDGSGWTADSQFFVFRMRSSGGHSPIFAPVMFWSRGTNLFYVAEDYTGDIMFQIVGRHEVRVSTLPGMSPATVNLVDLLRAGASELR